MTNVTTPPSTAIATTAMPAASSRRIGRDGLNPWASADRGEPDAGATAAAKAMRRPLGMVSWFSAWRGR